MTANSNNQQQNEPQNSFYLFRRISLKQLGENIGLTFGKNSSKRTSSSQITWTFGSKTCLVYNHTAYSDSTYISKAAEFTKCDSITFDFSDESTGKGYIEIDLHGVFPQRGSRVKGGYKNEDGTISLIHRTADISKILDKTIINIYSNGQFASYDILITAAKPFKITINDWVLPPPPPPIQSNSDGSDMFSIFSDPSYVALYHPNNVQGMNNFSDTSMMTSPLPMPYNNHHYFPMNNNNQQPFFFHPYHNPPNNTGNMN